MTKTHFHFHHSKKPKLDAMKKPLAPQNQRRNFLIQLGVVGVSMVLAQSNILGMSNLPSHILPKFTEPLKDEDLFAYIQRISGRFDLQLYKQLVGAANEFKEGDQIAGIAAANASARTLSRNLIANTQLSKVFSHPLFKDQQYELIQNSTVVDNKVMDMTFHQLKQFLLESDESAIKGIMPALSSDIIAFVVKLMTNDELVQISSKVFNALPNSQIGAKGYVSARIQPNSPTDNTEDIIWQVLDAWSYGVGDLVLGTNPVSSDPNTVASIETALHDLLITFQLENTMPHCVLSHIDIQSQVETMQPGTTGIWFQSLAGTVAANQTFDVTIEKMESHAEARYGNRYGLYAETGQGADATNGHGEGFDMVVHESRKYGLMRALKKQLLENKKHDIEPWVFLNDVAGFIGPEVFRTKEQLVRCCLEDLVMGKLHGLTIGLDICTTLHMDVTLDDLDWCIDQIMPANPAYFMALPTKNDPMLSYLTSSFADHVRVREKFGYKVNDAMWEFFKRIDVIGQDNQPSIHFGQPLQVYLQYCRAKGDTRNDTTIIEEGKAAIERVRKRGVPIAEGYGEKPWQIQPSLEKEIRELYTDAKYCLWTEWQSDYLASLSNAVILKSLSKDRIDYVYHPASGERLASESIQAIQKLREQWGQNMPDVQIVISDGLNAQSLMDNQHLEAFLPALYENLALTHFKCSATPIVIQNGRVRAGYETGEHLFGNTTSSKKSILHIIGERPGTIHRNFSVYITSAPCSTWNSVGAVDHDITRVVSGISDTAYLPADAAKEVVSILTQLMRE